MLKVGELARRSGLTIRTLHHYDSLGLLRPSARSDAGYRLYDERDLARLHGIQALRSMGLGLAEIGEVLGHDDSAALPALLARQITALDEQIERSHQLRARLQLLHTLLATGSEPALDDWLGGLALMSTCSRYFSADELRRLFEDWARTEAEWPALVAQVQAAMDAGVPTDAIELQLLARRWMDLTMRWMRGDTDLLQRWRQMFDEQPLTVNKVGIDRPMLHYIEQAIELRMATLGRHLTPDEIARLDKTLQLDWRSLSERAQSHWQQGTPPGDPAVQALAREWRELVARTTRHDVPLAAKLIAAYAQEPLLRAGGPLPPELADYLRSATMAPAAQVSADLGGWAPASVSMPQLDPHAA